MNKEEILYYRESLKQRILKNCYSEDKYYCDYEFCNRKDLKRIKLWCKLFNYTLLENKYYIKKLPLNRKYILFIDLDILPYCLDALQELNFCLNCYEHKGIRKIYVVG